MLRACVRAAARVFVCVYGRARPYAASFSLSPHCIFRLITTAAARVAHVASRRWGGNIQPLMSCACIMPPNVLIFVVAMILVSHRAVDLRKLTSLTAGGTKSAVSLRELIARAARREEADFLGSTSVLKNSHLREEQKTTDSSFLSRNTGVHSSG